MDKKLIFSLLGIFVVTPCHAVVSGSYCAGLVSGTMAAGLAANSPIVSFRFNGAANTSAIVKSVILNAGVLTAFAAGTASFSLIPARPFTVSDSGGNAATLTGDNTNMKTSYPPTGVADFRVSSTATLTAGTRTLDTAPIAVDSDVAPAAGNVNFTNGGPSLLITSTQPLQLVPNEGFVVQASVPGTGTWSFSARICWDESGP